MKSQNDIIEKIIKKIRLISIQTKKKMNHVLAGNNATKMIGHGLSFDQIREYQHGDDVRLIDWKAYARTQALVTKQYSEERRKKIFILYDVSRSSVVDTGVMSKADVGKTVLATIMLAAAHRSDSVATMLYADKVVKTTEPVMTLSGATKIIRDIFLYKNDFSGTSLKEASRELIKRQKKSPATIFVISDFIDETAKEGMSALSSLYDVYAIRTLDPIELRMPVVGLLPIVDIETGIEYIINTARKNEISAFLQERIEVQNQMLRRFGVPILNIYSHDLDIVDKIMHFFKKMERRQ